LDNSNNGNCNSNSNSNSNGKGNKQPATSGNDLAKSHWQLVLSRHRNADAAGGILMHLCRRSCRQLVVDLPYLTATSHLPLRIPLSPHHPDHPPLANCLAMRIYLPSVRMALIDVAASA